MHHDKAAQVNPNLFFVSVFDIQPGELAQPLEGSCGFLWWHAEVVHPSQANGTETYLVIYQSSRGSVENEWSALGEAAQQAVEIANSLVLPLARHGRQHLIARLQTTILTDNNGKERGRTPHGVQVVGSLGTGPTLNGRDYPLLLAKPRLKRALQYFNAGMYVAELGLPADACMNYVRAIESLFGMFKDDKKQVYANACTRLGLDFERLRYLMGRSRNEFAIAHASDTLDKDRDLKTEPGTALVHECHVVCREVIIRSWVAEERDFWASDGGRGFAMLYDGYTFGRSAMPVPTIWDDRGHRFGASNLPTPQEVIDRLFLGTQRQSSD